MAPRETRPFLGRISVGYGISSRGNKVFSQPDPKASQNGEVWAKNAAARCLHIHLMSTLQASENIRLANSFMAGKIQTL